METTTKLDELARKVQRAYYEDGLADLFMGIIFLGIASLCTLLAYNVTFLWIIILTLNPLFYLPLIERAKQRWVYPRAGYVKPKPYQKMSTRVVVLILVFAIILLFLPPMALFLLSSYAGLFFWLIWIAPVTMSVLISIGPFVIAHRYHIGRYYLFALLLPVIGVIVPWLNLSFPSAYAAFFTTLAIQTAVFGLLGLLSGTVLFLRFLHRYPVESIDPAEGENLHAFA
ncbi:MAG: hypothetical protein ACFFBR_07800 [Promethearchaeota archaeon]